MYDHLQDMAGNRPKAYPFTNGFSLNMLGPGLTYGTAVHVLPLSPETVMGFPLRSCIGHADTAAIVAGLLNRDIRPNRETISLIPGDSIIAAQYLGPRLPEGATTLPEGARIELVLVSIGRYHRPELKTVWFLDQYGNDVPVTQVVFPDLEHD